MQGHRMFTSTNHSLGISLEIMVQEIERGNTKKRETWEIETSGTTQKICDNKPHTYESNNSDREPEQKPAGERSEGKIKSL